MARRTFFSFHYDRDITRANVVRNSWVTQDRQEAGFWDASLWENAKRNGDDAIRRMIDEGLKGTSVTVVLIGAETGSRRWVQYEIFKSLQQGNGLLGVYINQIKNLSGEVDQTASNPLTQMTFTNGRTLSTAYPTYGWYGDKGYENLGSWIEKAAVLAGR